MIKIINIAFYLIFLNSYICENNVSLINKAESTQFVDLQKPNLRHGGLSNSYTIREKYNNLGGADEKLQNIQGFYNTNGIQTIQGQDDSIQADEDPNAPKEERKENSVDGTLQVQLGEGDSSGTGDHPNDHKEETKRDSALNESEESRSVVRNPPSQNSEHVTTVDQDKTSSSNEGLTSIIKSQEGSETQNQLETIPDHQEKQEPLTSGGLEKTTITSGVPVDNKGGSDLQKDEQHEDQQERDAEDSEDDEDEEDDGDESEGEEEDMSSDQGDGVGGKTKKKGKKRKSKKKDVSQLPKEAQVTQDSVGQPQHIQSDPAVTESDQKHSSQEQHVENASGVDSSPQRTEGVNKEGENLPSADVLQVKELTPGQPQSEALSQETKIIEGGIAGGSTRNDSIKKQTDQSDLNTVKEVDKVQTSEQEKKTPIIQEIAVPEDSYDEGDEDVEEEEEHEVDEEEEDEDDEEQINEEEELDGELDYDEIEEGEGEVDEVEDDEDDSGGEEENIFSDERETRDSQMENGDSLKDEKQPTGDILSEEEISESAIEKQRKQEESRRTEEGQSHENSEQQKQKEIKPPSNDSSAHKSLIKDFKDDSKVKKEAETKVKNMINLIGDKGVA
ncbi:merozoite surface protein 3 [Plasmodium gallinaceum]|uniref:Merozoite surface protein 3 n=1 Tax=Plasmodium gallinaceum TaxID=5849 RepID=A0A1J1GY15_PLAGA|nr:merozoite surface protein 3 [Plasmodium gallinaceum]CRG97152.1 merozoite surface protein 3 [Plasmodium gallinaceum]